MEGERIDRKKNSRWEKQKQRKKCVVVFVTLTISFSMFELFSFMMGQVCVVNFLLWHLVGPRLHSNFLSINKQHIYVNEHTAAVSTPWLRASYGMFQRGCLIKGRHQWKSNSEFRGIHMWFRCSSKWPTQLMMYHL